jgi:hypothetical protein
MHLHHEIIQQYEKIEKIYSNILKQSMKLYV